MLLPPLFSQLCILISVWCVKWRPCMQFLDAWEPINLNHPESPIIAKVTWYTGFISTLEIFTNLSTHGGGDIPCQNISKTKETFTQFSVYRKSTKFTIITHLQKTQPQFTLHTTQCRVVDLLGPLLHLLLHLPWSNRGESPQFPSTHHQWHRPWTQ